MIYQSPNLLYRTFSSTNILGGFIPIICPLFLQGFTFSVLFSLLDLYLREYSFQYGAAINNDYLSISEKLDGDP